MLQMVPNTIVVYHCTKLEIPETWKPLFLIVLLLDNAWQIYLLHSCWINFKE